VRRALDERPLDLIVNTHLHSDHCGGNAALHAAYRDARTLIPPGLADAVRVWDEGALTYAPTGQRCERFAVDDVARPGRGRVFGGTDEVAAALARARNRLAGLAGEPTRHAAHGVKVLIKFKLLECQSIELARLLEWASATRYVRVVHERFFGAMPVDAWLK